VFFSLFRSPPKSINSTPATGKEGIPTRARAEQRLEKAMQDGGEVLFLDGVGEVAVTIGRNGLSARPLHPVCPSPVMTSMSLRRFGIAQGWLQILLV
jgi:hypothetical protein